MAPATPPRKDDAVADVSKELVHLFPQKAEVHLWTCGY